MQTLEHLLSRTSRTFALAIELMNGAAQRETTIAYLLLRIADTFEDATLWPREARIRALHDLAGLIHEEEPARVEQLMAHWTSDAPCEDPGCMELIGSTSAVLAGLRCLPATRREIIVYHVRRTIRGMSAFVERGDEHGHLELADEHELRQYCYVVAGIVGEMLTEIFLDATPALARMGWFLHEDARAFGEALQLVNILKDSGDDARHGRVYIPARVPRLRLMNLARKDLRAATRYVLSIQQAGASRGLVAFTALPVLLAQATLDRLALAGPGAKLTRSEVMCLVLELNRRLDAGVPAIPADAAAA